MRTARRFTSIVLPLFALTLLVVGIAKADDTQIVRLTGFLTEESPDSKPCYSCKGYQLPADGDYTMSFELYDTAVDGQLLASDGPYVVEVIDGRYLIALSFDAASLAGGERFLAINVDGERISPLSLVVSAPFGYLAQHVRGPEVEETAGPTNEPAAGPATGEGPSLGGDESTSADAEVSSDYEDVEGRHLEWLSERTDNEGFLRPDLWRKAVEDTKAMEIDASIQLDTSLAPGSGGVAGVQWVQVGPEPLLIDKEQNFQGAGPDSGEVLDVAIDPRNLTDEVVYIATNQGGIWKTTDGGTTWAPKTDYMPSLSMGAVSLHPNNPSVVYAGTGNLFDGAGQVQLMTKALGIYRSADGGDTWTILNPGGIFSGNGIHRIVFPPPDGSDPAGADVVLVASRQGLYRSVDGGLNFGNNAPLYNNGGSVLGGFITDLKLDTTAAGTVHAAQQGNGIFRSTDSGITFPTNLFTTLNGAPDPTTNLRFIWFDQSTAPDNQTIYASVQGPSGVVCARGDNFVLSKSTDYGATWVPLPQGNVRATGNCCQCGYDQTVGVDPVDPDRVYIAFQEMFCSNDGGLTFPSPACSRDLIHWDHHAITFTPASHRTPGDTTTRIWAGTDGGVHYSNDGGSSWANPNDTISTNILFHMDMGRGSAMNNQYIYGGCQDTGTIHTRPAFGKSWHMSIDGDGQGVAVDATDPTKAYGGGNNGYFKTTNAGTDWTKPGGRPPGSFRQFVDRNDGANVFVTTGTGLYMSTDTGSNFNLIRTAGSSIRVLEMEKIDSNTMWLGLNNGNLEYTENLLAGAASTWTTVTVPNALNQRVTGIAIDPDNTDRIVVVYPGFCGGFCAPGNRTRHVFYTTDQGQTWTDISGTDGGGSAGDLPDLPVMSVVIDPQTSPHSIIVSTITGVMRTSNLGASWQVLGLGLPNTHARTLQIDHSMTPPTLRIGTYGRSVFSLEAAQGPLLGVNTDLGFGPICLGGGENRSVQMFNTGSEDLNINAFFRLSGSADFEIIGGPPTPVTIPPGESLTWTVRYQPTTTGDATAIFQINSNDQFEPEKQISASGMGVVGDINATLEADGNFGDVQLGRFGVLTLQLLNQGTCSLDINNVFRLSGSSNFTLGGIPGGGLPKFPLSLGPNSHVFMPLKFQPTLPYGPKSATFRVLTTDADTPMFDVAVQGNLPEPDIRISGSTDFGEMCAEDLNEKELEICNVGLSDLNVSSVSFNPACTDFTLVNNPFPAPVSHDFCLPVTIRYTPSMVGIHACQLEIVSDDPDSGVVVVAVTGSTAAVDIDVPADLGFLPEVNQTVDTCQTLQPFPISNNGNCELVIPDVTIAGATPGDYGLSGLPSFPIQLAPGHIAGDGDLNVVFAPQASGRERAATVEVTYVSDPVTGATSTVTRNLCGEGVLTGARVLVTEGGVPMAEVDSIHIQRINANRNGNQLDTVSNIKNAPLVTSTPTAPCPAFSYHAEFGTVDNPVQLLPGSYQVSVHTTVGGKKEKKSVGFDVSSCDFNPTVVVTFP